MNGILIVVILLTISSAQHILHCHQSPIQKPTKVNVENQKLIITGNALGEIGVCQESNADATTTVIIAHNAPIVFIERYMADTALEYVVIDQSGTVTIWNNNFTQNLETLTFNATVIGAAIREKTNDKPDARLALNCKTFIIELSLIERKQLRRLDDDFNILALVYSQTMLIASSKNNTLSKLVYFNQSGLSKANEVYLTEPINFLSRGKDYLSIDYTVGLSSKNQIARLTQNATIEMSQPITTPTRGRIGRPFPASDFQFCKSLLYYHGRSRRSMGIFNGVVAIVYNDVVVLRSTQEKVKWIEVRKEIADISCIDEHLYVLTKDGKLVFYELWQFGSMSQIYVAGVGLSLIVLVFALVGYKVAKRWAKKKEMAQTCVQTDQTSKEIQLREFLIRETN